MAIYQAIVFSLALLALTACVAESPKKLHGLLFEGVSQFDVTDSYRACIFLAEIPIENDALIDTILDEVNQEQHTLCYSYIIAKRSMYQPHIDVFIKRFPHGSQQVLIWQMHFNAGHPISFVPPYVAYLNHLARHNDKALDKLVSALPFVDGSYAETLNDLISDHYSMYPHRVLGVLKTNGIGQKSIDYIINLSTREK